MGFLEVRFEMSKSGTKLPLPHTSKAAYVTGPGWGKRALGSRGDGGWLMACLGTVTEWGLDEEGVPVFRIVWPLCWSILYNLS